MTVERFTAEVNEVRRLDPQSPYLSKLMTHSFVAEAYLAAAWKRIHAQPIVVQGVKAVPIVEKDDTFDRLTRAKSHIRNQMRTYRIHVLLAAKTDSERKTAMEALDAMQVEWSQADEKVQYYLKTGKEKPVEREVVSESEQETFTPGALTDLELAAQLNVCRASISRLERKIVERTKADAALLSNPKHPLVQRWQQWEASLKLYRHRKGLIENELQMRKKK